MNILIVTEKPSVSQAIAPLARKHWPFDNITFVHANPYGNIQFSYPRGLKLREYPLVTEPRNRLALWESWLCAPFVMGADGSLAKGVMSAELFTAAERIVCACDPDATGAVAFDVLMTEVLGSGHADNCATLELYALDAASIEYAFANMKPYVEVCARGRAAGRVKRYFDWNWNVNSLAIFGMVQRNAGVVPTAPPLSKYALQLLYGLRSRQPMTEGKIVWLMKHWPGTGKYSPSGRGDGEMGGPASRTPIIENLLAAGCLARIVDSAGDPRIPASRMQIIEKLVDAGRIAPSADVARTVYVVSPLGHVLLNSLHPDCEDPDLPFRLDAWCAKGEESKPAIDRYIRTFFGKQLRYMGAVPAIR
ncbi:hypothetical protein AB4Y45_32915 [Paraburkholderia sp. EG287A]|uniref:hypothetical protein n=1 Tax=Paraburkholderia sp. EG287A TaxID=3237012 RepID=UPI0034D2A283